MGPAWFWEGQPRIASLIQKFSPTAFEQYSKGALNFEDQNGSVQRGRGFSLMESSCLIKGGLDAMVQALLIALPKNSVTIGSTVTKVIQNRDEIEAQANGQTYTAKYVIFALPPTRCRHDHLL